MTEQILTEDLIKTTAWKFELKIDVNVQFLHLITQIRSESCTDTDKMRTLRIGLRKVIIRGQKREKNNEECKVLQCGLVLRTVSD